MRAAIALCVLAVLLAQDDCDTKKRGEQRRVSDEEQITRMRNQFVQAWNARDAALAVTVYTDPHVDINAEIPLETRATTEAEWSRFFERFDTTIAVTSDELMVTGDWAFQRGELLQTVTPRGGGSTQTSKRRYLEILKREPADGWRVFWAMDGPIAENK